MKSLILSRPDLATQLTLYPVERVSPVIKAHFGFGAPLPEDIADAVAELLPLIGNSYGGQYVALLQVEPDGQAYLPVHAKEQAVISVARGPQNSGLVGEQDEPWYPGLHVRGRQWVSDQFEGVDTWRLDTLESLAEFRTLQENRINYQRTEDGIFVPELRRASNASRPTVIVVYNARLTDARGYCLLADYDAMASAYYWNKLRLQRAMNNGDQWAAKLFPQAELDSERQIATARTGEGLSPAAQEFILRTAASWDRATFAHGHQQPGLGYEPNRHSSNGYPPMFSDFDY